MELITNSEYLVWLAKLIGIISFGFAAVISMLVLLFRARLVFEQRRVRELHDVWQPILVDCLDTAPEYFPDLDKRDIKSFLVLWNYFHETLRDAGKENLNQIARHYKLDDWSERALSHGSIRERLLAIQTLGWLHEERCWDKLDQIMRNGDPVTSLCAAKALVRIDARKGVKVFVPIVAENSEWSYATVGKLMREVGAEIVTDPLIDAASSCKGEQLVRLLRFIRIAYEEKSAPLISRLLRESECSEVILSCLRAVDDPADLPRIRELLKHEDWRIRTQSAICLGRLGTMEDVPRLAHAAGDREWWVRLRAATALANLPSVTNKRLRALADAHHNPYASDAINKVRLEKEAFQ